LMRSGMSATAPKACGVDISFFILLRKRYIVERLIERMQDRDDAFMSLGS
jgi:hypothetical protein